MALESATYIDGLVATNPAASDAISTADDHLRLIKATIKATFPNITGPVTKTQTEINALAPLASPALTGTPTAPTASPGTDTTQIATTAFTKAAVDAAAASLGTMSTQAANSVAITGGSITGITDLAVADGGTGASSITANSVILGNGTSALSGNLVAPGTSGNLLTSNGTTWTSSANLAVGVGQTWQNVTSSRSSNVTYTNSTGKPIAILASRTVNPYVGCELFIDGAVAHYVQNGGSGYTNSIGIFAIIPSGSTYKLVLNNASEFSYWFELR